MKAQKKWRQRLADASPYISVGIITLAAFAIGFLLRPLRPPLPDTTLYVDALAQQAEHLPNHCSQCMLHNMSGESDLYLLYINSGEAWDIGIRLDLAEGDPPYGYNLENRGEDPWSGTRHVCQKRMDDGEARTAIKGIDGVALDLGQLKSLYCDDCIDRILSAVRGHPSQLLLVDPQRPIPALYPIDYGSFATTSHSVRIVYDGGAVTVRARSEG